MQQTIARQVLLLGDEAGEECVGLGQDGGALLGPVGCELVGNAVPVTVAAWAAQRTMKILPP
uniref:Uncharacterized protein n=1 Tax=Streptomyces sp. NBC_00093 TaxID=2975649 RepID=A0AAU2AIA9_9ACTN